MPPQYGIVAGRQPTKGQSIDIVSGFNLPSYDRVDVTYPTVTTEVYTLKNNNLVVAVITVVYTDSTKTDLLSVSK